jgi:NADPH2:quinone reductase
MRAVVVREFGSPEVASVETIPDPKPGPNDVLVAVKSTAVNFVDLLVIGGKYQFLPERPFVPGKLPVGQVTAIGSQVTAFKVGDRVQTLAESGGYAEIVAVPESQCYRLPDSISFADAASMALAYDTAWFALRVRARCQSGETVLVLGASGGVGLAAMQLAKAFGLRVIAGISTPAKAELVRNNGADEIVDLSRQDLRDSLREQVYAATSNKGVEIILDSLGGDYFDAAIRSLAWSGRFVVIGFAAGRIPVVKANYLLLKNIEVSGLQVSDYRKRAPEQMAKCFTEIFSLYEQGQIKPAPTITYPLEKFRDALDQLQGRLSKGRIVLAIP